MFECICLPLTFIIVVGCEIECAVFFGYVFCRNCSTQTQKCHTWGSKELCFVEKLSLFCLAEVAFSLRIWFAATCHIDVGDECEDVDSCAVLCQASRRGLFNDAPRVHSWTGCRAKYRILKYVSKNRVFDSSSSWLDSALQFVLSQFVPHVLFEYNARHDVGAGGRGSYEIRVSYEGLVRRLISSEGCEWGLCETQCRVRGCFFVFCVFRTVVAHAVREAEDVSRCTGQKLIFQMKHISAYFLRFLSQHARCARQLCLSACFGNHCVTTLN